MEKLLVVSNGGLGSKKDNFGWILLPNSKSNEIFLLKVHY